jgi:prepilin-type N-terminal cleavage/methylation domain-containing protein
MRRTRRNAGFSLIELMSVLAVAAVLMAIAQPELRQLLRNLQFRAAVNELSGAIGLARGQAIARGARVELVPRLDRLHRPRRRPPPRPRRRADFDARPAGGRHRDRHQLLRPAGRRVFCVQWHWTRLHRHQQRGRALGHAVAVSRRAGAAD